MELLYVESFYLLMLNGCGSYDTDDYVIYMDESAFPFVRGGESIYAEESAAGGFFFMLKKVLLEDAADA